MSANDSCALQLVLFNKRVMMLGNVAEIQNFLRITKINLWSNLATRGRGVHLHTIVDRDAEALQERG